MPKNSKRFPKRGEIYIADLDPAFGAEVRKRRPVLIISNNIINQISQTVLMVPFSSIIPEFIGPDVVEVGKESLEKDSVALVSQIRSIDRKRLLKKIGQLSSDKVLEVEESLKLVLGMVEL